MSLNNLMQTKRQQNTQFKRAKMTLSVISALAILSLQTNVYALGMGDIVVKSHLGQPLLATIKLQGAAELKNATCFRLGNDIDSENQINNANFKLSNIVNDEATLTISTNQAITDPIVNVAVIAECDSTLRRDYVVLLDPILSADIEPAVEQSNVKNNSLQAETQVTEISKSTDKKSHNTIINQQTSTVKANSKKLRKSKNLHSKITDSAKPNKNIILTINPQTNAEPNTVAKTAALENKPRLSISGTDLSSLNNLNLHLDKQLHFTQDEAAHALAANIAIQDTAVQDDVTVMNNRLAHLQQQISALQTRNQTLEVANKQKVESTFIQNFTGNLFNEKMQWMAYLLGGSALVAGVFSINYWRRRKQQQQLNSAEELWDSLDNTTWDNATEQPDFFDAFDANGIFSDASNSQKPNNAAEKSAIDSDHFEITQQIQTPIFLEDNVSEHNILDHADVFLSHGRTSLAVQLLQNHLLDFPKQSVTIWLFLLDLLAKENMQAVYEQTALECKEHFNIRIAAFSNDEASPKQSFEDFPRLNAGLQDVWGKPAAVVYLDDLIYNSRLETRVGFEKSVLEELLLLKSIAHEAISTASVIQLDEKKLMMKEMKEAQIAAKKVEKLEQLNEISIAQATIKQVEATKKQTEAANESREAMFEFNMVEFK